MKELSLDDPRTTLQHRDIILNKPFLKRIYTEWYTGFKNSLNNLPEGRVLEIGSGGGFLKDIVPQVITSDIMELSCCDMTFSAEKIPFEDNSVSAIFMLNVLHHIPDCRNFFSEAERVLKPGGMIYMIEPANTPISRFIYKRFHHEPFQPESKEWTIPGTGPLSDANGAIPWLVFKRDYSIFKSKYPSLNLESFTLHSPFKYLASGGLTMKSLVPYFLYPLVQFSEWIFTPFNTLFCMFQTIVIRKIK